MQGLCNLAKQIAGEVEVTAGEVVISEVMPFGPAEREAVWAKLKAQSERVKSMRGDGSTFQWYGPNDSVSAGTAQTNVADLSERQEVWPSDVLRAQAVIGGRMVVSDPSVPPRTSREVGGVLYLHPYDYEATLAAHGTENAGRCALPGARNVCEDCGAKPFTRHKAGCATQLRASQEADVLRSALKRSGKKVEPAPRGVLDPERRPVSGAAKRAEKSEPESLPWVPHEGAQARLMREHGRTLEPRIAAALTMEPQAFSRRVWSLQEE